MKVREEKLPEKMLVKNHYIQQHPILNFSYAEGGEEGEEEEGEEEEGEEEEGEEKEEEDSEDSEDDDYKAFKKDKAEKARAREREKERKRSNGLWARIKNGQKRKQKINKRLAGKKGASLIRAKYNFKKQIEDWNDKMKEHFVDKKKTATYNKLTRYHIDRKIFERWFGKDSTFKGDFGLQCEIIKIIDALWVGHFSKHMLVEACDVYIPDNDDDPVEPNTDDDPIARLRLKLKNWLEYPTKMKRVAANKKFAQMKKRAGGIGFGSINQFRKFL